MTTFSRVMLSVLAALLPLLAGCSDQAAAPAPPAAKAPAAEAAVPDPQFRLEEHLGQNWSNECVTLPAEFLKAARPGRRLVDADGRDCPWQVVKEADKPVAVVARVDLPAFQQQTWRFVDAAPASAPATAPASATAAIIVEEDPDALRLTNGSVGVAVARTLDNGRGPLLGVRLRSGKWIGGSRLATGSGSAIDSYKAEVTARGPVFAEVTCAATFAGGGRWAMRFRVQAGEPVVLVDESFDKAGPDVALRLELGGDGWPGIPDTGLNRSGKGNLTKLITWPIPVGDAFVLEPWLHWWEGERQGPWVALYNAQGEDALVLGACNADRWVDPAIPVDQRSPERLTLKRDDAGLHIDMPLRTGQRRWLLGATTRQECLDGVNLDAPATPPVPQRFLLKHGYFPLDLIKDYTLAPAPGIPAVPGAPAAATAPAATAAAYPRLLYTPRDIERYRQSHPSPEAVRAGIPAFLKAPNGMPAAEAEKAVEAWVATGDAELARRLIREAEFTMQGAVDALIRPTSLIFNSGPLHASTSGHAILLADLALAMPECTPESRRRLLAQAAFLGYTAARPDFWSPGRDFCANPNMTTWVAWLQTAVGGFTLPHPKARDWSAAGIEELRRELNTWSDDRGGWLEAPHYAMVSIDGILGGLIMAHNAGLSDDLFSPRLRAVIEWFARISTPPDARINGIRHFPPIGNTYIHEPTGTFGTVAYLWRDRDPAFSAQMQWMHRQHGSYPQPGIGGAYPALSLFRPLLRDDALPAAPPQYASELFPQTGAVLRNGFPTDRETQLYLIAGDNHAHYDLDSGSITLWGKGRIVADDFGYYGNAPTDDHNRVESPVAGTGAGVQVREFHASETLDYIDAGVSAWKRQIAFVKDSDPLGPNYFVVRDSLDIPAPAVWRLWCTAAQVKTEPGHALVVGKEDVDTDIFFFASDKEAVSLTTEEKTRRSVSGFYANRSWGPLETTQTGVIAKTRLGRGFMVVIYPRLKSQPAPVVTALPGGVGVKVQTERGTDHVFLNPAPATYNEGGLSFRGIAGAALTRDGATRLEAASEASLEQGGQKSAAGRRMPAPPRQANLLPGGDFESGWNDVFIENGGRPLLSVRPAPNPAAASAPAAGAKANRCLAVDGRGGDLVVALREPVYVDASRTYRVRVRLFVPGERRVEIAGYGWGEKGNAVNLTDANGVHWQWGFAAKGPMKEWQTLEMTIGPPGSGAKQTWPPGILATGMTFWIRGEPGYIFVDDVVFEPIE